ncbi:FHA domain-containing protein [Olsenella sp. Marseille-P4559]|uniref:FHA domain-containing protein n=1 Tax=Olsenella sp. Marseille-P4559 TaxID=2364795 RepID=UPI001A918269|nr:FHA domain-containing protein [Olsenella sp. Marseille-P4559]
MKEKLKKSLRGELRLLTLTLGNGERLDYVRSEWLAAGPGEGFLPFRYEGQGKGAILNYDVEGLVKLPQFVRAPLSIAQYESLLRQLSSVVALCVSQDVPTSELWCDPEGVFVTPEGRLRLVLVPVSGYVKAQHSTPLELLAWLGSPANAHMAVEEDYRHVSAVGDWARRQSVFSPQGFERFLDGEYGRRPVPGRAAGLVSPTLGSSGSSPYGRAPSAQGLAGSAGVPRAAETVGADRGQHVTQGRGRALLDPLGLLGMDAQKEDPRPVATRVSRAAFEVVPHEEGRPSTSGDTSSLGSGSLGTSREATQDTQEAPRDAAQATAWQEAPHATASEAVPEIPQVTPRETPQGTTQADPGDGARMSAPPAVYVTRLRDGLRLRVQGETAMLGRSSTCDLHFGGNPGMSRRHLEVRPTADGLTIRDLGSSNGTYVAGSRLASQDVAHVGRGGRFTIAGDEFLVE